MNIYEEGFNLAKKDIMRFGFLHASDKAEVLDGDFGAGYNDAVTQQTIPLQTR